MGKLDGSVAIVTGGARGMGASHVRTLVAEGAKVVIGDILDAEGRALADEIGPHGHFVHHDVTDESDWATVVREAVTRFGRVDILVNNAGILRMAPITDMALEHFRMVMEVNATSQWLGIKSVAKTMADAGGGSIINISSVEGFVGGKGLSAYSASKFASRGITRSAAKELAASGIRVNSIHPGGVDTPMTNPSGRASADAGGFMSSLPIPRYGRPQEISNLVLFLAGDDSSYCTGSEFVVDGGMLAGNNY